MNLSFPRPAVRFRRLNLSRMALTGFGRQNSLEVSQLIDEQIV
jgi:hypothetical protein